MRTRSRAALGAALAAAPARAFLGFLRSGEARAVIERYGYGLP